MSLPFHLQARPTIGQHGALGPRVLRVAVAFRMPRVLVSEHVAHTVRVLLLPRKPAKMVFDIETFLNACPISIQVLRTHGLLGVR